MFKIFISLLFSITIIIITTIGNHIVVVSGQQTTTPNNNNNNSIPCNKNGEKQVDALLARVLTFGDSGREFPESQDQIPAFCNETQLLVKSVEQYVKKCTKTQLSKQLFSVYVFTIKSQLTQLCKTKPTQRLRDMLSASKCVNRAKPVFTKCVQRTVDHLQRIRLLASDTMKIPHLCCEYNTNKQCNREGSAKITDCTDRDMEIVDRFVDSVAGNSMNLLCGDYDESSDKCKSLPKLPKNIKKPQKFKSFFIPSIEVISSLQS
ncbi:uncharacterized protein LOC128962140 [Oppia nitens]|uniref:uncharacterized protein LOC128962140 n=1 Tax=Oppia nitens TaxID=1686743 RepID=UPI0023DBE07C|nr:uncharacterized protein LOC128962140 [Oppia nitens]